MKQQADNASKTAAFNGQFSRKVTPPRGYAAEDIDRRVEWLAGRTGHRLDEFALEDPANFKGLSENQIGYLGFPLSIAGPLRIDGTYAKGDFYVPLCTLEGTLSFSMTRGFYLTYLAGGITSRHIKQQLSRCPVFTFKTLEEAHDFLPWIDAHAGEIQATAESTTRHGKLLRVQKRPIHNRVLMEFNYDTAEAAGQNMVTIATDAACRWIMEQCGSRKPVRYLLESNFSGDKNPTQRTMTEGRGHHVICSFSVPDRLLRKLLKFCVYGWRPQWFSHSSIQQRVMPGFAFPAAGPVGLSSPPYRSALPASDLRYYAPLRLPSARLGSLPFRSLPDTLPAPLLRFPEHRTVLDEACQRSFLSSTTGDSCQW